jgi:predicted Zn-dependent protease
MKKEQLVAQLEAAKALTSVVSIDNVIALIQALDPEVRVEKVLGMSQELAEEIAEKIERSIDYNSNSLIDFDSAEFELSYRTEISLTSADVDVREIMEHVTASLESFVIEEDEEGEEGVITDVDPETQIDGFIEAQIEAEQASQEE